MGQTRGRQADLGVFEPFAGLAQHLGCGHAQVVDRYHRMAAGHRTVDGIHHPFDPDRRVGQIDHEHAGAVVGFRHDDAQTRTIGPGDIGLAAVDDPMVTVHPAGGQHHRRVRPRAAVLGRFGHKEGRAHLALHHGRQEPLLQLGRTDLAQQVHVALIRGGHVAGHGAKRRQAGPDQHGGGFPVAQVAAVFQYMRGQDAGLAGGFLQFHRQVVGRPVRGPAGVFFIRRDGVADKGLDPVRDLQRARAHATVIKRICHFGAIRIAPSRRIVSPFSMVFSTIDPTIWANSDGSPRRGGKGT